MHTEWLWGLGRGAKKLAADHAPAVLTRAFRDEENVKLLRNLLGRAGSSGCLLGLLDDAGLLGSAIPIFGKLHNLPETSHLYGFTVDRQARQAVMVLDQIFRKERPELAPYAEILEAMPNAEVLYLATLIHDGGKYDGSSAGHEKAGALAAWQTARALGLSDAACGEVEWLVANHSRFVDTAERSRLNASTVERFCAEVGSVDRLLKLFVLSYADKEGAASPHWKDGSRQRLFHLFSESLSRMLGRRARKGAQKPIETVIAEADSFAREHNLPVTRGRIAQLLTRFSADYAGELPPRAIARHALLLPKDYQFDGTPGCQGSLSCHPGLSTAFEVFIAGQDRPGFFAHCAAAIALSGLSIGEAQIFSSRDGSLACNAYSVSWLRPSQVSDHDAQRYERGLRQELAKNEDLVARLRAGMLEPRADEIKLT
jgi:[protein-PII] uridylyltransferase